MSMAQTREWRGMKDMWARLLKERTGKGVDAWNRRIRQERLDDEDALRAWLTKQGVTGYAQSLLVMERFGYPDFLLATADELIDGQYADRPKLRPIFDAIIDAASGLGEVTIQARKTYVSLVSQRRTFARIRPTTKNRVDLGLRHEVAEQLSRLRQVLGRFVPETPVVREEIGDMVGVDRLPIPVGRGFHVVPEEQHDQVHEILPTDLVDLQLLEDHVRERDRGGVELQPPVPGFLSEQDVVAEFELVEEDVDVEPIFALVVHEPSVAEETVDHVVRPESKIVEHAADRAALTRVPHQVEVCK